MPAVHPFRAVCYSGSGDQSALVAPPYDVLDAGDKQRLLAKDSRNIVGIDLPHTPAKELGPAAAYANAGERLRSLVADRMLVQTSSPVMFAYRPPWADRPNGPELPLASKAWELASVAVAEATEQGALREPDPVLAALTIWSAVHGVATVLTTGTPAHRPIDLALVTSVVDAVVDGLAAREPRG